MCPKMEHWLPLEIARAPSTSKILITPSERIGRLIFGAKALEDHDKIVERTDHSIIHILAFTKK